MGQDLQQHLGRSAFAFRGYNVTNLGRTAELLACPAYQSTVERHLTSASQICSQWREQPVDLIARVRRGEEASLEDYAEAVALVFAVEMAQIELLREFHGVAIQDSRLSLGYSLGELVALVANGLLPERETLAVPLAMAPSCAELAADVSMGILFSRQLTIPPDEVATLCQAINAEGQGVIDVSAILSPNSYLLLGQRETVRQFRRQMKEHFHIPVHLRLNESLWPPLHTAIVRQKAIPDRAAVMMQTLKPLSGNFHKVFSLVTGQYDYSELSVHRILRDWVDHPQLLWAGIVAVLKADVSTVIHVGPEPNVIPATFQRLSDNVLQQTQQMSLAGFGARAARSMAHRPWLAGLLPSRVHLLRAPALKHVILEDWLLEHAP